MTVVELTTDLAAPPDRVWDEVCRPRLLLHVARGFVSFRPVDPPAWPDRWAPGEHLVALRLWGVLPLGRQVIAITLPPAPPGERALRDNGRSRLVRRWDHWIHVAPGPAGARYADRVTIEAGWLTRPVATFARAFYRHRQRRLRALAATGFVYQGAAR